MFDVQHTQNDDEITFIQVTMLDSTGKGSFLLLSLQCVCARRAYVFFHGTFLYLTPQELRRQDTGEKFTNSEKL